VRELERGRETVSASREGEKLHQGSSTRKESEEKRPKKGAHGNKSLSKALCPGPPGGGTKGTMGREGQIDP